ncbi:hypothetical protein I8H89_00285 [Candidatus Saccharibacteria bacterium]|nr:hypothetical protein [Candidatus Saccharibacteria bacterium]
MQEILTFVLALLSIASIAGMIAGLYYGQRQKTIIEILEKSNSAYQDRNKQLEEAAALKEIEYNQRLSSLEGQVDTLQKIKTPPLDALIMQVAENHKEVMEMLGGKRNG